MVTTLQTLDNTLASLSTFKGRISSVAHHLKITIGVVEFNSRVGVEIEKGSTALGAQEMAGDPASGAVTQDGDHADDRGLDGLLMDDVAVDGGAPDGALVGGEDQCGSYEVKRALDEDCHSKTG